MNASILIVDDHADFAEMIADHLRGNYTCRIASGGKEAITSAQREIPDLVVTDLRMAEVDGLDVLD
ncbi:MAG TPA: response regulator, partial [Kofleriaceae bacterium]